MENDENSVEQDNNRPQKRLKNGCDPYEIGKGTFIKKGEVRNPGGRPKKKPITSAYARAVEDPEAADKLAMALYKKACAGDVNAAKELREGIEGKALQAVRLDGELDLNGESDRKSRVLDILREGAQRVGEKIQ